MSPDLAERLASYASGVEYSDLDESTVRTAKERVLDSLACAYAARGEAPVENLLGYARTKGGTPTASVVGEDSEVGVEYATLANGSLVRYLDWNDTYLSKEPGHPSDNLGAVLSVADAYERSGEELLLAIVVAYELQCRLCDAASLRKNGFDHVNYGLVSSTLAAARLMGLSREEMVQATNIALNGHVALRQARSGELTEWKGFAFANAARNAVVAAELASAGVEGPAPIFEGEFGVFEQLTGEFSADTSSFGGSGGEFRMNETHVKFYPVEYHAQAAVNCALALREQHDVDWKDVEKIENETYEAGVSIIAGDEEKWRPETRETADHSMPYCVARAFIDGRMTLDQFSARKIRDPDVRRLMDRVEVRENEEFSARYGASFPHRMRVLTDEGEYEWSVEHPKGHAENPLTGAELERKFETAAARYRSAAEREETLERVWNLEAEENVAEFAASV